jgi:signal transduction histidine kinase/ligand-binding sensor domain-containing protein
MKAIALFGLAALLACFGSVTAKTRNLSPQQLNYRAFTSMDGAPTDMVALAQTVDGTLWMGGRAGLTRFDGIRFVPYPGTSEEPLQHTNISALFGAPDGSLWIGFRPAGVAVLKNGHVTHYSERDGLPRGAVQQIAADRDGSIWIAARRGVAHFANGRCTEVVDESELNTPYGVLVDRAGTLWVATLDGLRARAPGEQHFREIDKRRYFGPRGLLLSAASDGRIWAAAGNELVAVDPAQNPVPESIIISGMVGGPLLPDANGNLWTADPVRNNLMHITSEDLARLGQPGAIVDPENVSRSEGLSRGFIYALLEDREGNIWVATNTALHRFSRSNVVHDIVTICSGNILQAPAFAAGDAGALWVTCGGDSDGPVAEIRDGKVVSSRPAPPFSVAYRDRTGKVWFAGRTALAHLDAGRVVATPLPAPMYGRPVQALLRDSRGGLWVAVTRRSTYYVVAGEWIENDNLALPREPAYVETADDSGVLWFGYTDNRIARIDGRDVKLLGPEQGLKVGNVLAILAQDGELWVSGELGFARFDGQRFVQIRNRSGQSFNGVSGIVRARNSDLWLNGAAGISHISRRELEQLAGDPTHRVQSETFNYLDGVPGTAMQLRPQPSAAATTDGRIWFAMTGGLVSIDPSQIARNTLPPPITIWALTSGDKRYPNLGADLHLPVHTTDVQIEYSAGSLTVPERVHFRYRLEGLDRGWHDVGNRREALYTNLGPGNYRFRVIAANNDGLWNETGASVAFTIAPTFYQTRWFRGLCVLACVAILAALYRIRMRRVAAQISERLGAQLAERERIARELHDTLLQGMQGVIWRFQAAAKRIPPGEAARQLMEQSLDRADRLLIESRDKVKDLRSAARDVVELANALAAEGEELAQLHHVKFSVRIQGTGRELHPIVREEGFSIAREALTNAFRHASASTIEAEVAYNYGALSVRVRDDGQGISPSVMAAGGRPGHFGLAGMRERAAKLGAHLEVWSKPGAGTEWELRVPAKVAYRGPRTAASRAGRVWLALFSSVREK